MFNKTEKEEKAYLKNLLKKVEAAIGFINERIQSQSDEVKYLNNHIQEFKTDMDHLEKNAMREAITNTAALGDHSVDKKKRLLRLRNVPYFGRIDFRKNGDVNPQPVYVGVHNFYDEDVKANLVYDWRAPISSMFYDFELGEAFYKTSDAKIEGSIDSKRQFRIRKGEMEYMLNSDIIKETFQKHSRKPILNRFNEVVREIVNNVFIQYRYEIMGKERTQLHITIRKMFPSANHRMLYKDPFSSSGLETIETVFPDATKKNYSTEPPLGNFDFVFATECFEHFFRPSNELYKIRGLLNPGGILVVMTQLWKDTSHFKNWGYAHDPTHVVFYHEQTFRFIAANFGFEILEYQKERVVILRKM